MLSDLESIRIAETYYQDMYLKYLPIPHFKMPEVTIEMPVAVMQVNPPGSAVTNNTLLSKMRTRIKDDLSKFLVRVLLALKDDTVVVRTLTLRTLPTRLAKLTSVEEAALNKRVTVSCQNILDIVFKNRDYTDANTMPLRLTRLADDLELTLSRELSVNYLDYVGDEKSGINEDSLKTILRMSRELFLDSVTFIMKEDETTLNIMSSTTDLINLGDMKYMTTIKITIREQDYEWSIGERGDNGVEERHLLIE
jgi:uncharacterized protein (DUF1499 family)